MLCNLNMPWLVSHWTNWITEQRRGEKWYSVFIGNYFLINVQYIFDGLHNVSLHCGSALPYVHEYLWKSGTEASECVHRKGVPSSIRDTQQPFLVLDGAVRMHRLVPSLSGAQGMYSSIREWRDNTWEVSSSIRTDRITHRKKHNRLANIKNLTGHAWCLSLWCQSFQFYQILLYTANT